MFPHTPRGQHGGARDCTEQCGHEQHHGDRGGCNGRGVRPVAERSSFGRQRPRSPVRGFFSFLRTVLEDGKRPAAASRYKPLQSPECPVFLQISVGDCTTATQKGLHCAPCWRTPNQGLPVQDGGPAQCAQNSMPVYMDGPWREFQNSPIPSFRVQPTRPPPCSKTATSPTPPSSPATMPLWPGAWVRPINSSYKKRLTPSCGMWRAAASSTLPVASPCSTPATCTPE